jgi:hypothetical protein
MGPLAYAEEDAIDRLAELGLTVEIVERVVRRADAEAGFCTRFDPPIMEGLTRWARTNRFLREELVPAGWSFDNPRNLPRTIHPRGEFAIVAATGDQLTGLLDLLPATKYPKGDATARAVLTNEQQLTLDFEEFDLRMADGRATDVADMLTWFMLFHVDDEGFHVELSLPDAFVDGRITSWAERIILPVFPRHDAVPAVPQQGSGDQDEELVVAVSRR